MAEEKNGVSGFKVVDRRSFTTEGTRREGTPTAERESGATAPQRPNSAKPEARFEEALESEAPGFDTLVSYLSTTAMFQLGLMAGPSGERIPSDLPNARRTIDLLEILQQKTRGNLTAEESRLLEDVRYELRMTYVEIERRQTRKGQ